MDSSSQHIRALLADHGFLRRLARGLMRDEHGAEDLAQQTWLAALESPPTGELRPWFVAVARNFARGAARERERREQRERMAARPEALPSTEQFLEREATRRELVAQVLALDEIYRTVIVLRFFEGWAPRRIARELGVPVETVKTRLKRALEQLRAALDAQHGDDRAAWCVALAHAAGFKSVAPLASGALWMSTQAKLAIAVAFLVVGGVALGPWIMERSERDDTSLVDAQRPSPALSIDAPAVVNPAQHTVAAADAHVPASSNGATRALALAPAHSTDLVVRVVDPAGDPVPSVPLHLHRAPNETQVGHGHGGHDVPVPWVAVQPHPASTETNAGHGHGGRDVHEWTVTTNIEGIAVFEGVRPTLETANEPWVVTHEIAFEVRPTKVLDRDELAQEVVQSLQPFSGALEVQVDDLDGGPIADGAQVEIRPLREEDLSNPDLARERPGFQASTRAGRASFAFVELGRSFDASAWHPGWDVRSRARGPGPLRAHARAVIDVRLGSGHRVYVLRAVDENHVPLANVELAIARRNVFGQEQRLETHTDSAGLLRVDMIGDAFRESTLSVKCRSCTHGPLSGRIRLNRELETSATDPAEVVLVANPLLVAGRVEDASGRSVAGAEVKVIDRGRRVFTFSDNHGRRSESDLAVARTQSDADGHFELYDVLTTQTLELIAQAPGLRSSATHAYQGQTDVVLVVVPMYTLSGRVLMPPGIAPREIRVELAASGTKHQVVPSQNCSDDGSFEFDPAPVGLYDVAWILGDQTVHAYEQLALQKDVQLEAVDLRARLQRLVIALLGASDPARLRGEIAWRPSASEARWKGHGFQGSTIELVALAGSVDVRIRPQGFQLIRANDVSGRRELRLVPALRVRLELHTNGPLPKFPYLLFPELFNGDELVGEREGSQSFTDENRSVVVLAGVSGKLRVRWKLELRTETGAFSSNILAHQEVDVEVRERDGEQALVVELDGSELHALVDHPPW